MNDNNMKLWTFTTIAAHPKARLERIYQYDLVLFTARCYVMLRYHGRRVGCASNSQYPTQPNANTILLLCLLTEVISSQYSTPYRREIALWLGWARGYVYKEVVLSQRLPRRGMCPIYKCLSCLFTRVGLGKLNRVFPIPPIVSPKFLHVLLGCNLGREERRCWANCPCN